MGLMELSRYEQDLRRKTRRRETSNGRGRVRYLTPRPALFNLLWFRCSTLDYEQVQTIAMWCTRGHVSTRVSWHRRMVSMTQSINPSLDPRHGLPPNAPPRFPAYMPIYLQSPQGQTGEKSIGLVVMGNARRICHTGFCSQVFYALLQT
jgi:hypothetical protein